MKTRTFGPHRSAPARATSFALHPLSLASLIALAGPALALPQGGVVVGGKATITKPTPTTQVVTQGTDKAIIDWTSFSIAAGEKVRFDQPSSSAVVLNRVTGYDPSKIFGHLEANGRVFLLNPYGVVFGASARVDVGGLVASSLSLSNADFNAGRLRLTSSDGTGLAVRGEVRNEGVISASGGTVVLAAPQVTNTGTIEARAGRVGMAAVQDVLVDVEGDGLIFFQASATEASNRLAQLGRIQADGGSVELRAAARGAFADTVLNMSGVVQARSLGMQQGRVVIDGGEAGITRVAGTVDASGASAGEQGGRISVRGQKVLLDLAAVLNASGDAGGGTATVGGDWQGRGAGGNAELTHVAQGARIDVSATGQGDGGTAVVWADSGTAFYGDIAARGGASGGDGGRVEVSGKQHLAFAGTVDTLAPLGRAGALLLDPSAITIASGGANETGTSAPPAPFTVTGTQASSNLPVGVLTALLNNNGSVTVDATVGPGAVGTGSISVETAIGWGSANTLTLRAETTITSTAAGAISNTGIGGLNLFADGAITLAGAVTLGGGTFNVAGTAGLGNPAASFSTTSTITTAGANGGGGGNGGNGGGVAITTAGNISIGQITATGGTGAVGVNPNPSGGNGGNGGTVNLTTSNGTIQVAGVVASGGGGGNGGAIGDGRDGGNGGNAGTITLAAAGAGQAVTASGSLTAIGGTGGIAGTGGGGGTDGGDGGNGGTVTVGSAAALVSVSGISSQGGAGGAGGGSNDGTNANIALSSGTNLTVTGALNTGGGGGTTIGLSFGQAGAGGTLNLDGAGTLTANAISATGGAGTDTIAFTSNAATMTLVNNQLSSSGGGPTIALSSIESASLTGGAADNTIAASGWTGGRTATIRGGGGADDITGNGVGTTLVGGVGATYNITGGDDGNIGGPAGTTFTDVGNLTGGTASDSFVFAAGGTLSGNLAGGGGAGNDTLNLSAKAGAITVDRQAGTATGIGGSYSGIGTLTGNGATTTLVGLAAGEAFTIATANAGSVGGLTFSGVGNLTGGAGANSFTFADAGSLTGNLVAGPAGDTLDLSAKAGAVAINLQAGTATGIGGTLNGTISALAGNGANTTLTGTDAGQTFNIATPNAGNIVGGPTFSGVGTLTGGSGTDAFVFANAGTLGGNVVGGGSNDTLDLSAKSGAVAVNQQTSAATGLGGTFASIEVLVGNGTNTTLTGSNAGQTFTLATPGQGTAGALDFSGTTSLVGGSGADTFSVSGTGALAGSLTDTGGTTTLNGTIETGAGQDYAGNILLGSAVALTSTGNQAISLGGTVNGAETFAITTSGLKTLGGAVGGVTPLTSLTIAGGGNTSITGGAVSTTGTQSYDSAVTATTLALTTTGPTGDIVASNTGNDFGTVSLQTANGANVTLVDANSLVLGNVNLGTGTHAITAGPTAPGTGTTLSRGATFTAGSTPVLTVGGVSVDASVRNYFATGTATTVAIQKGTGTSHNLSATGAGALPTLTVSGNLDVTGNTAITQTGAINVAGTTSIAAGANAITLNGFVNNLAGAIDLTNSGANNVALDNSAAAATTLRNVAIGGGFDVAATGGAIGQTAGGTVAAGTSSFNAGANAVALDNAGNDFTGAVSATGGPIAIADANALAVAAVNNTAGTGVSLRALGGALTLPTQTINTGAGNLTLVGTGGIAQGVGSTLVSGGTTTVNAGTQAIALTQANVLSGTVNLTGGNTQLTNTVGTTAVLATTGPTTLNAVGQTLGVSGTTSGALSVNAAATTLNTTGALSLGASNVTGNLGVTTNGAGLSQSGVLSVTGTTDVAAGAGSIALGNPANTLQGVVTLGGATTTLTNNLATTVVLATTGNTTLSAPTHGLAVSGTTTGALSLTGANTTVNHTGALNLGTGSISGTLGVTTNGTAVTQSGALGVNGTTNINAGAGNVTLANAGNDFVGAVTVNGGAISVVDANNLTVTATPGTNQSLSLVAGGTLAIPGGNIDTGTADLTLSSGTGLSTTGTLRGANLTLGGGSGGITLNDNITATGTLTLTATNAAISQAGGNVSAGGNASVNAGNGAITLLGGGNDFQGTLGLTGGTTQVTDANALTLGALSTGSLGVTNTGALGLGSGSVAGNLVASSNGGAITQSGALGITGTANISAGAGNVTLANAGNDFVGAVTVNGGAISVVDANNLTVTATPGTNQSLSLVAGGTLAIPGGNIDTGTADLTLSSGTGLSTTGTLRGANLTLGGGTGGIALNNDITASGALNLSAANAAIAQNAGNIGVGTTTNVNAGSGNVTLLSFGNDFQGTVNLTGGVTQARDANALTLGTVSASALGVASTGALNLGSGNVGGVLVALSGGGAVSQSGALSVAGAATINAGSGSVTLTNAGNDFSSVAATGGAISLRDVNALVLGSINGSSLAVDTSAGNGALTQTGASTVSGSTSITAGSGNVTLTNAGNNFGSFGATAGALSVVDAAGGLVLDAITAQSLTLNTAAGNGAITQTAAAQVAGATTIAAGSGNLTLTQAGNDFTTLALAGGALAVVDANNLNVTSLSSGANQAVSLVAGNSLVIPGGGINTGTADLTLTSNNGALTINGALVGRAVNLTGGAGITLGGNVTSSADQTFTGALALTADAALNAGAGRIALQGAVDGGGHNLALTSSNVAADAIRTGGAVANTAAFTATGNTTLGGNVTTTGNQTYTAALALAADAALNAGAGRIVLQGAVDGGGHNLALTSSNVAADAIRTGGAVANTAAFTATGNTTLGGNVTTTGNQTYTAALALAADAALNAGAGRVVLQGAVDGGGHNLALTSSNVAADAIRTGGAVANTAAFTATGNTTLGGNVTTTGDQTYTGSVQLTTTTTLSGVDLTLLGSVDGAQALTLAGTGTTTLAAALGGGTALTSITDGGGGTTRIGESITTTGTQTWGDALVLTGASTLTGTTLSFGGTIDGAQALTVVGIASTAVFNGAIGNTTALASLAVSGPTQINGGSVTTTGSQSYAGAVTLGADTVLAGNGISFLGTLDGARALTVQNAGGTLFGGAVGGSAALASLALEDNGAVSLTGPSITTTGAQSYSGSLQLAGNAQLTGTALSFGAGIAGAQDLLLRADTLNVAGTVAGTGAGTLTIAPLSAGRSIGVAGGAGDLQVAQALLGGASGFAQHIVGSADGSGDITAGALQLAANTTLQTGGGNIRLNGTVDGGFDLTLNAGGLTHIAGPVGTLAALRSLTTDNNAGSADWDGANGERTLVDTVDASGRAHIVTTGAQTYNDPLIVLVPVQFNGGAIGATRATSRFDGTVHANAAQLDLRSGQVITLGDVTLGGGGRIETDGVLELAGALVLNGGTLSLVTNATPTSVDFTDPELQGRNLTFGLVPVTEASATLFQSAGATLSSTAGSLLVLRSTNGGSLALENAGNDLRGGISAVSGTLGDNDPTRFTRLPLAFVRINSTEINAVGAPPADGSQTLLQAGIEGDVLKLSADKITTGPTGLLRARLPFDNSQGSQSSVPGMTLIMSPTALTVGGGFGLSTPDGYIQVRIGSELGGFLAVRPRGASGDNAFILLAGPDPKPFYDGNGKLTEVRVFYNGDAPRTPQESGALTAVTAIVEDARQTRFEEAVRTENVKSRLRSGVIAEVGAGRPATVGRESIQMPQTCNPKAASLQCE